MQGRDSLLGGANGERYLCKLRVFKRSEMTAFLSLKGVHQNNYKYGKVLYFN